MRVSPPRVFPEAAGAPRPAAGSPGADAHRQAGFVLGNEVDSVLLGLELEGEVAAASAGSKFRTQPTASGLAMWSRSWLSRLEALHAVQCGNYTASFPLLRAAADYEAAGLALLDVSKEEWTEWLAEGGIGLAAAAHATEFKLHAFRSAETLAANPALADVYRIATDLSLPHFGATALLAASESTAERMAVTFGDRDFHLGLAEIALGLLLSLGTIRVAALAAHPAVFAPRQDDAFAKWLAGATKAIDRADRCRVTAHDDDGERRHLIVNWRRTPSAAAKRMLL